MKKFTPVNNLGTLNYIPGDVEDLERILSEQGFINIKLINLVEGIKYPFVLVPINKHFNKVSDRFYVTYKDNKLVEITTPQYDALITTEIQRYINQPTLYQQIKKDPKIYNLEKSGITHLNFADKRNDEISFHISNFKCENPEKITNGSINFLNKIYSHKMFSKNVTKYNEVVDFSTDDDIKHFLKCFVSGDAVRLMRLEGEKAEKFIQEYILQK
jgi:hypothetical protein